VRALSAARSRCRAWSWLMPSDCGALGRAAAGRAVEADVEAAVLAEHDRRGPAQDHAAAGGGEQAVDPGFAVAAQVFVLVVVDGGDWVGRPAWPG